MSTRLFTRQQTTIWLTPLVWWLVWFLLQGLAYHRVGLSWSVAFTESLITTSVFAALGLIVANTFQYYRPVSRNFLLMAGYVLFLTAITGRFLFWLFTRMHSGDEFYADHFLRVMPLRGMFYFLMISLITAYYWFRNKSREEENLARREKEVAVLMRDAELARLRMQLQPHFLFNSLNSISALAGSRPEEARKMIQQLSDFLRGTLKKDENQVVPLREEFHHLHLYLEIEKVRFGHRLKTEIHYHEPCGELLLPSLLLQPVVENAVKFGLYDTTDEVTISIEAKCSDNELIVEVRNPFDPETARPASGTGFGLSSIRRRLHLIYGRQNLLTTETQDKTFITRITIPQEK